jgi:hypothetical protein
MELPKIKMARALAKALQADGVIVLAFSEEGEGQIAGASYGADKEKCALYGRFLDDIISSAERGIGWEPAPPDEDD